MAVTTKLLGRGEGRRFESGHRGVSPGRPKKDLFSDPDRYTLAWVLSLKLQGRSLDSSAKIVCQAKMRAWTIMDIPDDLRFLEIPGKVLVRFDDKNYPSRPSTIKGAAWALQKRIARYQKDQKAALWLQTMAMISTLVFNSADEELALHLADKIKEIPFCVCIAIPMMRARQRLKKEELAFLEGIQS